MREVGLLAISVVLTLGVGLALVRWLAPGLLGQPVDMQVVQVREEVAPFYDTIFDTAGSVPGLLRDPYTGVRARPLVPELEIQGPNDVLGFRNQGVPDRADVVVIGDSQTYGVNARFEATWPRRLGRRLGRRDVVVYSMAAAGWSAVQYLDMFEKSAAFHPSVAVVAFYTGNDPRESFRLAYSVDHWKALRPDASLGIGDLRPIPSPHPREERWSVPLRGSVTVFTPKLRMLSNEDQVAVRAGWAIMADVGRRIAARARDRGVRPVFTIVPTKELVFEPTLRAFGVELDPVYRELVRAERRNLAQLADGLASEPGARYVDVLQPLQAAVRAGRPVYAAGYDGHPRAAGHAVIAATLAPVVRRGLGGPDAR